MASKDLSASSAIGSTATQTLAQRKTVGLVSVFAGLCCLYFVGFAPMAAVHNAAHDTRHGAAFPCH